ncbi:energy-coupling factor transporter ATPase [Proteocatella sphenisci]|uniref:energy-coupling factor transporter ATPase n=1 Tax=Proteocatella sphenisci TaxID=181070 RepID=UPI00049020F3|nr:energy-coupling factor transporter ATPase [Proteocatella sphenisci]
MSIIINNLRYVYNEGTPFESIAIDDVSIEIKDGDFVGLIGHTGSGKSTLIQHLNGLIKPSGGTININGMDITKKGISLVDVRKKVGLVFQYPEYQLFEETIYKDIAFGPEKLGLSESEVEERVIEAMNMVGLDFERSKDKSPFELSGGQKRRVAIAGVIAMKPEVLVLDEPTAGLDPHGRDEILDQIKEIHAKNKTTVILVSHSMEDVSRMADTLIVMNRGKIELTGTPKEVFRHEKRLDEIGLGVPKVVTLMNELRSRGYDIEPDIITMKEAKEQILRLIRSKNNA